MATLKGLNRTAYRAKVQAASYPTTAQLGFYQSRGRERNDLCLESPCIDLSPA